MAMSCCIVVSCSVSERTLSHVMALTFSTSDAAATLSSSVSSSPRILHKTSLSGTDVSSGVDWDGNREAASGNLLSFPALWKVLNVQGRVLF